MNILKLANGVTLAKEAVISNITFDENMMHCHLDDERIISVPIKWYPRLLNATVEQRNNWEIFDGGKGIHWEDIDEDLSVFGFMVGCDDSGDTEQLDEFTVVAEENSVQLVNWPIMENGQHHYRELVIIN
jgi:hypothetical protein